MQVVSEVPEKEELSENSSAQGSKGPNCFRRCFIWCTDGTRLEIGDRDSLGQPLLENRDGGESSNFNRA